MAEFMNYKGEIFRSPTTSGAERMFVSAGDLTKAAVFNLATVSPSNTITSILNTVEKNNNMKPYNKMMVGEDSIYFKFSRHGDCFGNTREVIPRIVDVKTYDNKVVKVIFADGSYEKAVLSPNDTFSLEQGISICLTKKLLSKIVSSDFGGSVYNKLVDYALGVYDNKVKAVKEAKKKAEAEKAAEKKKAEKIKAKRAKRKAQLREEQIEIQAEAYRRAMQKD